jgi:hypothetical protein
MNFHVIASVDQKLMFERNFVFEWNGGEFSDAIESLQVSHFEAASDALAKVGTAWR